MKKPIFRSHFPPFFHPRRFFEALPATYLIMVSVSPEVTIDNTLGALFVGFTGACCVYGVLLSQVYTYFVNYPMDRPVYKFIVLLVLALETADQAFIGHIYYHYGVTNFSNPFALIEGTQTWSLILQQLLGGIVGAIVKIAFALRVWRFSERNLWITGLILCLSLSGLGLAVAFTVKSFMLPNVFAVVQLRVLGTISLSVSMMTDIITALALCFFLSKLRTGYRQRFDQVLFPQVYNMRSNFGDTSVISVTTVILYNIMPSNLIFIGVYFILSKLYAISFLATLNTRRVIRGRGTDRQGTNSNHTNMFHLGTRAPSMGPTDMDGWEAAYAQSHLNPNDQIQKDFDHRSSFPLNSFASSTLAKSHA
ncbi:hypothetical protein D9757_003750 [Collybiopsis confluens]|uniref:DUF6534 domain-containing protein n=1 Tax=Collybiopsis confluens TaxID=2823264 RepID=A0A8H5HUZ6_9AGAR|nr:hypothetical protein D9757_003750 [Collybiopsis confluens]